MLQCNVAYSTNFLGGKGPLASIEAPRCMDSYVVIDLGHMSRDISRPGGKIFRRLCAQWAWLYVDRFYLPISLN